MLLNNDKEHACNNDNHVGPNFTIVISLSTLIRQMLLFLSVFARLFIAKPILAENEARPNQI